MIVVQVVQQMVEVLTQPRQLGFSLALVALCAAALVVSRRGRSNP